MKDIQPGVTHPLTLGASADVDGMLFFTADDGVHGFELWKSNGTAPGTVMVKDINPGEQGLTSPSSFASAFGYAPDLLGDVNQDGAFNNLDIAPFVALLTGGRSIAEPTRPPARLASGNPFSGRPLGVLSLPTDDHLLGSSRQTFAGSH